MDSVLLTWKAKIPTRIGPFSKLASLWLNQRMAQHRSWVQKHEAEYNLDLVKACGADGLPSPPKIFLSEQEKQKGLQQLIKIVGSDKKPIIIHPGSAGSVQSWPLESFLELSHKLAGINETVIFTGGKGEEMLLERAKITYHTNIHVIGAGSLNLREFASVIVHAKLMISNSTGPLHIASALEVPTLSFYPAYPLVTSAKRWGPYGNPQRNKVLSPTPDTAPLASISVQTAFESATMLP
jgi:ADP-heptose:LPS heptosyltransferase